MRVETVERAEELHVLGYGQREHHLHGLLITILDERIEKSHLNIALCCRICSPLIDITYDHLFFRI